MAAIKFHHTAQKNICANQSTRKGEQIPAHLVVLDVVQHKLLGSAGLRQHCQAKDYQHKLCITQDAQI